MTRALIPDATRYGRTHEVRVGPVVVCVTINRDANGEICEVFAKADGGWQGHIDRACCMASLALQGGATPDRIVRHLIGDRTEPCGLAGQPTSIYDALGKELQKEIGRPAPFAFWPHLQAAAADRARVAQ